MEIYSTKILPYEVVYNLIDIDGNMVHSGTSETLDHAFRLEHNRRLAIDYYTHLELCVNSNQDFETYFDKLHHEFGKDLIPAELRTRSDLESLRYSKTLIRLYGFYKLQTEDKPYRKSDLDDLVLKMALTAQIPPWFYHEGFYRSTSRQYSKFLLNKLLQDSTVIICNYFLPDNFPFPNYQEQSDQ